MAEPPWARVMEQGALPCWGWPGPHRGGTCRHSARPVSWSCSFDGGPRARPQTTSRTQPSHRTPAPGRPLGPQRPQFCTRVVARGGHWEAGPQAKQPAQGHTPGQHRPGPGTQTGTHSPLPHARWVQSPGGREGALGWRRGAHGPQRTTGRQPDTRTLREGQRRGSQCPSGNSRGRLCHREEPELLQGTEAGPAGTRAGSRAWASPVRTLGSSLGAGHLTTRTSTPATRLPGPVTVLVPAGTPPPGLTAMKGLCEVRASVALMGRRRGS